MLVSLEAEQFRNLESLSWCPGPGRHLLLGGNGAGKSSLLEAVYAVATTRSFRTPRLAECVRHGQASFYLVAEVEAAARITLEVSWGASGRERSVNGSRGPLAEHLGALPVVAWTTDDVQVIAGSPARRRRFLDRGVVSLRPGALGALRRYREALGEKRGLLAVAPRRGDGASGDSSLQAWNRVLAEAAVDVAHLRSSYARALEGALAGVLGEISLPSPAVALSYRPSPAAVLEGVDETVRHLERTAAAERRRGMPLAGPHRDDLEIRWGRHPASEVTSAGERKLLSLALSAAHGRVIEAAGREPIYLLDDLDAELAADSLEAVWRAFATAHQVVASSNRPAVWEPLETAARWNLGSGRLAAA